MNIKQKNKINEKAFTDGTWFGVFVTSVCVGTAIGLYIAVPPMYKLLSDQWGSFGTPKVVTFYRPSEQMIEIHTPRGSIQYQPCQKHIFVEFNDSVKRDKYLTLVDSAKLVLGENSEVFAMDDDVEGIILESGEEFGCKYVSVNIEK